MKVTVSMWTPRGIEISTITPADGTLIGVTLEVDNRGLDYDHDTGNVTLTIDGETVAQPEFPEAVTA